jgi:hypothetical protein
MADLSRNDDPSSLYSRVAAARKRARKRARGRRADRALAQARRSFPPDAFGPPDFVGVGAQRSGTRWWYTLLLEHPQVYRPAGALKECHFFDEFWQRPFTESDVDGYRALFPRPPGTITGEWTPEYMVDVWTPSLLRRAAPDTRLLVLLRDPIDRFRSAIRRNIQRFGLVPELLGEAFLRGLYHAQLARLLEHYERERILVLQYEQCVQQPEPELAKTYAFLGLDESFVPPDPGRRVKRPSAPLALPAGMVDALRSAYRSDTLALVEAFPELDPGLWPTVDAA